MTDADVLAALGGVVDPEMPVISIVDLGILRGIHIEGSRCLVEYCPTFLGCPARAVIAKEIARAVRDLGFDPVVRVCFNPPWTPDQISSAGRDALRLANISAAAPLPPGSQPASGLAALRATDIECPSCRAQTTRLVSAFASTPCRALRRCDSCQNLFEQLKPMASAVQTDGPRIPVDLPQPTLLTLQAPGDCSDREDDAGVMATSAPRKSYGEK